MITQFLFCIGLRLSGQAQENAIAMLFPPYGAGVAGASWTVVVDKSGPLTGGLRMLIGELSPAPTLLSTWDWVSYVV